MKARVARLEKSFPPVEPENEIEAFLREFRAFWSWATVEQLEALSPLLEWQLANPVAATTSPDQIREHDAKMAVLVASVQARIDRLRESGKPLTH
jgi:hypothetical protein